MKILGAIPARAGSERIPGKNTKMLAGKTLVQWAEHRAQESRIFDKVIISTDNPVLRKLYPETEIITRPESISQSTSIDYEWIKHVMDELDWQYDVIAILRPTSPFRTVELITMAVSRFEEVLPDSMRAIELVSQRPEKMWHLNDDGTICPIVTMSYKNPYAPYSNCHEHQSKRFPTLYVQNGCLELVSKQTLVYHHNITGKLVWPIITRDFEGFDINTQEDFDYAEYLIESEKVVM